MTAWWHWLLAGWRLEIIAGSAALAALAARAVAYYREPRAEARQLDRDLDAQFERLPVTGELEPIPDLPSPARGASGGIRPDRAGEFHLVQPHYLELAPPLDPHWLDDQLTQGRRRHARQMYIQGRWRAQMLAEMAEVAA
jgi:hypothetical protein